MTGHKHIKLINYHHEDQRGGYRTDISLSYNCGDRVRNTIINKGHKWLFSVVILNISFLGLRIDAKEMAE